MRAALSQWKAITEQLSAIAGNTKEESRDEMIEAIDQLLDQREQLQSLIKPPFTEQEIAFGKELLQLEETVQKKLSSFSKHIRSDISEAQTKKGHMKSYVNPYSSVARDGTFYDTKR